MNIADAFQFQTFYHPTSLAVCVPGSHYGPISFGRLQAMSNSIGWRCLNAGLEAGDVVAILSDDPVFHLATILALKRIGAVSLSTGQPSLPDEFTIDAAITDGTQEMAGCEQVLRLIGTGLSEVIGNFPGMTTLENTTARPLVLS